MAPDEPQVKPESPEEELRWYPDPPEACEWPLPYCPDVSVPCSKCPYHTEQY